MKTTETSLLFPLRAKRDRAIAEFIALAKETDYVRKNKIDEDDLDEWAENITSGEPTLPDIECFVEPMDGENQEHVDVRDAFQKALRAASDVIVCERVEYKKAFA